MFIAQNSATRFEKKTALLKCRNFDGKRQTRNCSLTFAVRRKNAMLKVSTNKRLPGKKGHADVENADVENADMERRGQGKRGQAYKKFLHGRRFTM